MKHEEWRPVRGQEGRYEVSNQAQVRSLIGGEPHCLSQHFRKYQRVSLFYEGKRHTRLVHRLMAESFIPNQLKLPQVNHIDGNKLNNTLANLEWVTASGNLQHAWDMGLKKANAPKGPQHHSAKLSEADVLAIRQERAERNTSLRKLAQRYGLNKSTVRNILIRKIWKHI